MPVTVNRFTIEDRIKPRSPVTVKPIKSPVLAYSLANNRSTFEPPEYDLAELNTVEDVDSYVRQAHRKKVGLAFKEGWDLISKNPDTLNYIKVRFAQLEHAQGKPWRILMKELFYNLVKHSNAYLVKVRDEKVSGGFARTSAGKRIKPVAGYFIMAPETVEIAKDKSGKVTKYRQMTPSGRKKEYAPDLVVHFYLDKKTGFSMGTPILTPVKDDIRALRRIEENIDLLVYQHLFPMFQYKIGTKELPAQTYPDGSTEIDVVRTELEFMPPEGILVTPERHEITMVGAEGRALRAEGFLKHFKERVLAGLGVSTVDMGEGGTSNRNTADRLSDNIRDDVKAIQDDFEAQFDFLILRELLLEGKFGANILDVKNVVRLQFKEIDIERRTAFENHVAQMYSQHLYNEDEARIELGRDTIDLEDEEWRSKTFWKLVEEPRTLMLSGDEPYLEAVASNPQTSLSEEHIKKGAARAKEREVAVAKAKAAARPPAQNSGQRAGAARNKPSNQRGTRAGPKLRRDFSDRELMQSVEDLLNDVAVYLQTGASDSWIKQVIKTWTERANGRQLRLVRKAFADGVRSLGLNPFDYNFAPQVKTVENHSSHFVRKLARDLEKRFIRLTGDEDKSTMMSIMDITTNRVNAINDTEQQRAYNYGRLVVFKLTDNKVKFTASDGACEGCQEAFKKGSLDPKKLSIDDIPPVHPFCTCSIDKA
jgi:hypothetical protein